MIKDPEIDKKWKDVVTMLERSFGEGLDLEGVIFLVGVQELGKGFVKLSKSDKMDIMHIGICKLLSRYGMYELTGIDQDGWPHWNSVQDLPPLRPMEQSMLVKQAIVEYFSEELKLV